MFFNFFNRPCGCDDCGENDRDCEIGRAHV